MSEEAKTEETKTEETKTEEDVTKADELQQFLDEFEANRPKNEPAATHPTGENQYKAFMDEQIAEKEHQRTVSALTKLAGVVKESSGTEVDLEAIEGALLRRNLMDEEFRDVVSQFRQNPESVRRYVKLISDDIVKPLAPKIDPVVTDSKESVRAAAKSKQPEPVEDKFPTTEEVWAMDKKEFAQLQKDVIHGKR